jgi:thiol:disulfide interchange protein DsbD
MPCVFPVLSLKAAALAGHAHEASRVRAQGLAFLFGVVTTFLALAGALLVARAAGQAVGWGFQLQSPQVVAVLALVMLLVALNLSGVFEIGTSVQNAGSGLAAKGGLAGSFFTGVLAVVVAAPCTAPFMAGAIGYALVQPPAMSLAVFLALALGLAAPFVALSFAPALLKRMPKPGPWMDILRRALAFPMYAAAAWLVWVLSIQGGPTGLARMLGAAVLAAFAAWLFGLSQARKALGKPALVPSVLAAVALIASLAGVTIGAYAPPAVAEETGTPLSQAAEIPSEPWSPERVAQLQAEGRPIFVNFTAAWCVTCQVNDKVALSTKRAAEAFQAANAVYLKGDWTNRNAEIAAALAAQGRAGVPLYLVYPKGGGPPKVLPQLLTDGLVAKALKEAS